MAKTLRVQLDTAELRALAVAVDADPRTVNKILLGKHVRGIIGRRVARELSRLGYVKHNAHVLQDGRSGSPSPK